MLSALGLRAQQNQGDFSTWYWLQFKYKATKKLNINAQFQSRFNHNSTDFDKSNFFLSGEYKFTKNLSAEVLTQYTTSYTSNQYTLYSGINYRFNIRFMQLYYRTSIQSKTNHFSSDFNYNNPYSEWRNRLRLSIPFHQDWVFSLSTEPYLNLEKNKSAYFSRIRNIAQLSYNFNDFHTMTMFYLVEPTLNAYYSNKNNFVLGFTYQITIPKKAKEWKHFFDVKKDKKDKKEPKEIYNYL
mgnify:CR=1 FL=1|jgi:hypothetical protein